MREEEAEAEGAHDNHALLHRAIHQRTLAQLVPQFLMRGGWNRWGPRAVEKSDEASFFVSA